tara:strand:- start:2454 stop:3236 length:783 start_codon:yes stop_codon:yes gene_type:complete
MKKKLFIIGGVGNVYFQLIYVNSFKVEYNISNLLVSQRTRKLLGHAHFNLSAEKLLNINYSENIFSSTIFLLDLFFGKLFKKTFFTEVDLNSFKSSPLIYTLFFVGYFQDKAKINLKKNNNLIRDELARPIKRYDLTIHFRGGDFIKHDIEISPDYYSRSINLIRSKLNLDNLKIIAVTNDKIFAQRQLENVPFKLNYSIVSDNEINDFNLMMSSRHFIASNSTFSLIAAFERNQKGITIIPKEFFDKLLIESNDKVLGI